jgi:transcriptional regulator with XRE-family HTH domain
MEDTRLKNANYKIKNKEIKNMSNVKENDDYREIGGRLRVFRGILGFSQEQLADESGVSPETIEVIEKGESNDDLLFPFVLKLGQAFGLSIDWILYEKGRVFFKQGPKTPPGIYQKYSRENNPPVKEKPWLPDYYTIDDEHLLSDLLDLLRVPEAKANLLGQIYVLRFAFKEKLMALKAKKKSWNTGLREG